jgi:hypothetical protein
MIHVHLGRYGDIINTLPLLQHVAGDGRARLVISHRYADVLEGVSYVEPLVFQGEFEDLAGGLEFARSFGAPVVNLQVYGRNMPMARQTGNFVLEQWHRAGRALQWGLPLVFDRRDTGREARLVARHLDGRPLVLLGLHGHSSPFPHGERLKEATVRALGAGVQVLDLATVKAERIYDLLALYDRAACLVATDTAHQHLAHGSKVPVIALSTSGPTPWHSSPRRQGHVLHVKYDRYLAQEPEILRTIAALATGQRKSPIRILHVHPSPTLSGDALRRHQTAARSWARAGAWETLPCAPARTARNIGDRRDLPYMRDLIAHAIEASSSDEDIVVVSNSDVCVVPNMTTEIRKAIARYGAFFTHRWDFEGPVDHVVSPSSGKWYPGSDLFGFTVHWWKAHGEAYPDLIAGAEFVDCVLRQLIKKHCGNDAEIHAAVYHEKHVSVWVQDRNSPSNLHNQKLAAAWFLTNGTDDLDPFGPAEAARIRAKRLVRR